MRVVISKYDGAGEEASFGKLCGLMGVRVRTGLEVEDCHGDFQ